MEKTLIMPRTPKLKTTKGKHVLLWLLLPVVGLAVVRYAHNSNALLSIAPGNANSSSSNSSSTTPKVTTTGSTLQPQRLHHPKAKQDQPQAGPLDPPAMPHMRTPANCPAWMAGYAAFHKQQRGQPGAKYIVYSACPGSSGLGDRVRGMMYLTRQAAAAKRVVLFTWRNEPHELQRFMPPAGPIDWTLGGIEGYDYPQLSSFCGNASGTDPKALLKANPSSSSSSSSVVLRVTDYKHEDRSARGWLRHGGLQKLAQYKFVTIHTNEGLNTPCDGCPSVAEAMPAPTTNAQGLTTVDNSAACLYRYLFGLSDDVQAAAQKQLVELYGRQAQKPGFEFVAVHMRLGGMAAEATLRSSKGGRNGPLQDMIRGLQCIQKLGQHAGVDTNRVPVMLFTDHLELRQFILEGGLTSVVTPKLTPTHLARMSKAEASDEESAISTYIEAALLARARCAVYSRSGFSAAAWMMGGGTECYSNFASDLRSCGLF